MYFNKQITVIKIVVLEIETVSLFKKFQNNIDESWKELKILAGLTIGPLPCLLENILLGLLDDECLKASIFHQRTASWRVAVLSNTTSTVNTTVLQTRGQCTYTHFHLNYFWDYLGLGSCKKDGIWLFAY